MEALSTDTLRELVSQFEEYDKHQKTTRLFSYAPYPYQLQFHNAKGYETDEPAKQRFLMAGNGCVSYDTLITLADGTERKAGELYDAGEQFDVLSWDGEKVVRGHVVDGVKKPAERQYRVFLNNGKWFECTGNHKILTTTGYRYASWVLLFVPNLQGSSWDDGLSVRDEDAPHWSGRALSYPESCSRGSRQCDERLHAAPDSAQASAPLAIGVLRRLSSWLHADDLACKCTSIFRPFAARLSRIGDWLRGAIRQIGFLAQDAYTIARPWCGEYIAFEQQDAAVAFQPQRDGEFVRAPQQIPFSLVDPLNEGISIIGYIPVGVKDVYDFTVEKYHNYIAGSVAHHNTGKTFCAAAETAIHATGVYPDWWEGTRFNHPVEIIVGAKTNDAAVKVVQKELFGEIMDKSMLGTGAVPLEVIDTTFKMKPGVPGAISDVLIKHVPTDRWSKLSIMSYDQKPKAFMGTRFDVGWLDEEPPVEIWSQFIRGTLSRKHAILYITATPEEGMTQVVLNFTNDLKPGQSLITATWDDAPHLTPEEKEQRLAAFPPHEREMRSRGVPMMGSGLIFPFADEDMVVEPFQIPAHWPQIIGLDFGWNHPFAAVCLAWDRDSDTVYLVSEYRIKSQVPTQHADAIKKWGHWIPVAWPHDGLNTEKGTGKEIRQEYQEAGLNMHRARATNPPDPMLGQKEGEGGNSREKALLDMFNRMENGKFKVFSTCRLFLEEKRMYHRDEKGKIVDLMDDLISATRYAHMMLRHARVREVARRQHNVPRGLSNWQ